MHLNLFGIAILLPISIFVVLVGIVFQWFSDGRLPSIWSKVALAGISQSSTILATILVVQNKTVTGNASWILVCLLVEVVIVIGSGAVVRQARLQAIRKVHQLVQTHLTTKNVPNSMPAVAVNSVTPNTVDPAKLMMVLALAEELIDDDLQPGAPRQKLSGGDNTRRRNLFLNTAAEILGNRNHGLSENDFVLDKKDRYILNFWYTGLSILSLVVFIILIILANFR
jgi:hypothetical protein